MQQLFIKPALVGLIAHRQVDPILLIHNGFIVSKRVKAGLAVVRAHTALAHAAKAHSASGKVDDHVVDTSAAVGELGGHAILMIGKQIERKGLLPLFQVADHSIKIIKGQHRQNGAKALLTLS